MSSMSIVADHSLMDKNQDQQSIWSANNPLLLIGSKNDQNVLQNRFFSFQAEYLWLLISFSQRTKIQKKLESPCWREVTPLLPMSWACDGDNT